MQGVRLLYSRYVRTIVDCILADTELRVAISLLEQLLYSRYVRTIADCILADTALRIATSLLVRFSDRITVLNVSAAFHLFYRTTRCLLPIIG